MQLLLYLTHTRWEIVTRNVTVMFDSTQGCKGDMQTENIAQYTAHTHSIGSASLDPGFVYSLISSPLYLKNNAVFKIIVDKLLAFFFAANMAK